METKTAKPNNGNYLVTEEQTESKRNQRKEKFC